MMIDRFKASLLAALLGFAVFLGGPAALVGGGPSIAKAQSGLSDVMATYGVTLSKTMTQDQIAKAVAGYMNNLASTGGLTAVANFVAALVTTVGVSPKADTQAGNIGALMNTVAAQNPTLVNAIAGGVQAGATALTNANYTAAGAALTNGLSAQLGQAITLGTAINVIVALPNPNQRCSGASCT